MIAVDTSALCAILWQEDDAALYQDCLAYADKIVASSVTAVEWYIVCARRRGLNNAKLMEQLVKALDIEILPFDSNQHQAALRGFDRYGQGQGGTLNFGDTFSYALAYSFDIPLLWKGQDFDQTDLRSALTIAR